MPKPNDPKSIAKPVKTQENHPVPPPQKLAAQQKQIKFTHSPSKQQATPKDSAEQSDQTSAKAEEQANHQQIQPEKYCETYTYRSSQKAPLQLLPQFR